MNVYRLKVLCTEIYKSLNSFSPVFIKDIFKPNTSTRSLRAQQQHNLKTPSPNQTTFGTISTKSSTKKFLSVCFVYIRLKNAAEIPPIWLPEVNAMNYGPIRKNLYYKIN